MARLHDSPVNYQLFRFLLVAIANTLSFIFIVIVSKLIGFGDIVANFLGYSVAITQSFLLNRRWTFLHDGRIRSTFLLYLMVIFVAYLMNLLTLLYAIENLKINGFLPHVLGAMAYGVIAFFGMRYIVFRDNLKARKVDNKSSLYPEL